MNRNKWFTVGVLALWAPGVFVPSSLHAQHGPGRHGAGSQRQQDPGRHEGPAYDRTTEATFKGTVVHAKIGGHTMPKGRVGPQETLLLRADTGTIEIHLGPAEFLTEKRISEGDSLEVTGSLVTVGESPLVLAREIRKGGQVWTLRDITGQPLGSASQTETRGFWTKKRVLFAALAVKAALVTALLLK